MDILAEEEGRYDHQRTGKISAQVQGALRVVAAYKLHKQDTHDGAEDTGCHQQQR